MHANMTCKHNKWFYGDLWAVSLYGYTAGVFTVPGQERAQYVEKYFFTLWFAYDDTIDI